MAQTKDVNVQKALDILKGKSVIAHDRRKADAIAIDFKQYRRAGLRVLRPCYGISNTMLLALTKLADKVVYEGKKSGMPSFHFYITEEV